MVKVTSEFDENPLDSLYEYLFNSRKNLLADTGLDCSEIADECKDIMHDGYVLTVSCKENGTNREPASFYKEFLIPADTAQLSGPWGYHSIFVLHDKVYTAEIDWFCVPLGQYKKQLSELNPTVKLYYFKEKY